MLKVEPYGNNYCSFKSRLRTQGKLPNSKQTIIYAAEGASALASIICGIINYKNQNELTSVNSLQEVYEKQMSEFPKDIDYRKEILKSAGMNAADFYKLRPIVGGQEYEHIVKEFSENPLYYTPGDSLITDFKDNYDLTGVQAKTFRATMHTHTVHSDGALTVRELLDKSAKYADEVAKTFPQKAKNAPFTIAITDHDTLEGCKEAVKIISQNPEKYKNLRVILGTEMSVENRMIPSEQKSPISIHMTVLGLNPFDLELNKFFNKKKFQRAGLMQELIDKCAKAMPEYASVLNFEDSETLYPCLKNKFSGMNYPMRDYIQYKIIFGECFKKNSKVQKELKEAGINPDKITFNSFFDITKIDKSNFLNIRQYYYYSLKKHIAELLGKTPEKVTSVPEELNEKLEIVKRICLEGITSMDMHPALLDMEEAMNFIKTQQYGYMTWAHPACTEISNCLKNKTHTDKTVGDLFRMFKEKGGFAAEIHYPYFGELGKNTEWHNLIKKCASENNLYSTGGLDTHGNNIFYSRKS